MHEKEICEMRELCLTSCSSHSGVCSHLVSSSVVADCTLTENVDIFCHISLLLLLLLRLRQKLPTAKQMVNASYHIKA